MPDDIQIPTQDDLQTKIEETIVPEGVIEKIAAEETGKTVRGAMLDLFHLGAVEKILNTAENIEKATEEYKKGLLMHAYMEKTESVEEEVKKLEEYITSREGSTLFNKVIKIVNINPENPYYAKLLASALRRALETDFQSLFAKHIYALDQIEKLSPQALILLADYASWPEYKINNYESDHGIITSSWIEEFLLFYLPHKNITDEKGVGRRISHAFHELLRGGFIRSKLQKETDSKTFSSVKESDQNPAMCEPTELGNEILEYIEPNQ